MTAGMQVGRFFALAAALSIATVACYTAPPSGGPSNTPFRIPGYADREPAEIAILPVTATAQHFSSVAAAKLRAQLYRRMLEKNYSPLALDYVDQRVHGMFATHAGGDPLAIDALKSAVDTDAFLVVNVISADKAHTESGWRVKAKITLLEGRTGTTLFDQTVEMSFDVPVDSSGNVAERDLDTALVPFANRLVVQLPTRT